MQHLGIDVDLREVDYGGDRVPGADATSLGNGQICHEPGKGSHQPRLLQLVAGFGELGLLIGEAHANARLLGSGESYRVGQLLIKEDAVLVVRLRAHDAGLCPLRPELIKRRVDPRQQLARSNPRALARRDGRYGSLDLRVERR